MTLDEKLERIRIYSEIVSRLALAEKLGYQFGGDRNIYGTLGYPKTITFNDYLAKYIRQDIAGAVINKPANATWKNGFEIIEADEEETKFEKSWKELNKRLGLVSKFQRLDKLACLGRYAVLLLGLDDVKNRSDFAKPVLGQRKLLYVTPYSEKQAVIQEFQTNTNDPRYGLPLYYNINTTEPGGNTITIRVHYSRVIHVVYERLDSENYGMPVLEGIFNRLLDLEKVVGGSAEMFWKGARPGYYGKLLEDFDLTLEEQEELEAQIDEYEHNLRRFLIARGIDLSPLSMQVAEPDKHVDVILQMISARTNIPKRILIGSERGELASKDDRNTWNEFIENRRINFAEAEIIRPFIDRCIDFGILPEPESYSIHWPPLSVMGEKEKAEISKTKAGALSEYAKNPMVMDIMPPEAFYRFILGLSNDEIELIEELLGNAEGEESEE